MLKPDIRLLCCNYYELDVEIGKWQDSLKNKNSQEIVCIAGLDSALIARSSHTLCETYWVRGCRTFRFEKSPHDYTFCGAFSHCFQYFLYSFIATQRHSGGVTQERGWFWFVNSLVPER